jgi:hypothetical protein
MIKGGGTFLDYLLAGDSTGEMRALVDADRADDAVGMTWRVYRGDQLIESTTARYRAEAVRTDLADAIDLDPSELTIVPYLRCITVQQPWAELIASGVKRVENRGRNVRCHRGLTGIHAGLRLDIAALDLPHVRAALVDLGITTYRADTDQAIDDFCHHPRTVFGAVVAGVDLTNTHHPTDRAIATRNPATCCPPWGADGQWHIELAHPRRVHVRASGRQAVPWQASPAAAEQVWRQLVGESAGTRARSK